MKEQTYRDEVFNFKDVQHDYETKYDMFYDLMKFKVKEVLLISTLYDDFIIEEDGKGTEFFTEYSELKLTSPPPRVTRVSNLDEALDLLRRHKFDLVITTRRISGLDGFEIANMIKEEFPVISIVMLVTNPSELVNLPAIEEQGSVDAVFTYTGDSGIFFTMIKLIEDRINAPFDADYGLVRIILVIEDSISYYSRFLPLLYREILRQTRKIMAEGVNHVHKLLLYRGRPKILLARTYEEATELISIYKNNLLALISDVGFPKDGKKDLEAGFDLTEFIRDQLPNMPILLQSSELKNQDRSRQLGISFVHKRSQKFFHSLVRFLFYIGFGDFVFRAEASGREIARAHDLREFIRVIKKIPVESIVFHASRNDFSNWLFTRGEFHLAYQLRDISVKQFDDGEQIREFLIHFFKMTQEVQTEGVITEFNPDSFYELKPFMKAGSGSLGGKGRGLAFLNNLIFKTKLASRFSNISVKLPKTLVLTTSFFDEFIEINHFEDLILKDLSDDELRNKFLDAKLPKSLLRVLNVFSRKVKSPLAVRSSSLLEDSQFQPFAGIYATFMLPNNHPKAKTRAETLQKAVKLVYMSTFTQTARSYLLSSGQQPELEKMAVIIQKIVGKFTDHIFFPDFAGVGQSYNFYPVSYMRPEEGTSQIAVGLGEQITSGHKSLRFSPKYPRILPQYSNTKDMFDNSQTHFFALDTSSTDSNFKRGQLSNLLELPIDKLRASKRLSWLASTYDGHNDRIIDRVEEKGPLVVTFAYLLKYNKVPFLELLNSIIQVGRMSFGCEVEFEYAVTLDQRPDETHLNFYLLQMRPLITDFEEVDINISKLVDNSIIYSDTVLGNGKRSKIFDVVFVKPETFSTNHTFDIKDEVSKFNKLLGSEKPYILLGPGRWGTQDPYLGIPVQWHDIDNSQSIVEYGMENFQVDASSGQHFFLNITSSKKSYFSVPFHHQESKIDWERLNTLATIKEGEYIKWVHSENPLVIYIDGKIGKGVIIFDNELKKIKLNEELMDKEN